MQQSFVLDLNRCTGCGACRLACSIENELGPGRSWRQITTFNELHHPGVPSFHLSIACNHCVDPPCMKHCPALAYAKDPASGAVTVDPDRCIGCKYCTWACPFDAPQFNESTGLIEKCTLCDHRLAEEKRPACVSLCPTGALDLEAMRDTNGAAPTDGFPRTEVGPAMRFVPLREKEAVPGGAADAALLHDPSFAIDVAPPSKISLRTEWPLVAFTLLAATLAGSRLAPPDAAARISAPLFLALGAAGAALSSLHLGRKARAWRAMLNWRSSWLSREILLYTGFLALCASALVVGSPGGTQVTAATLCGFAALFAMDRVYEVTRTPGLRSHSAQALLTGAFLGALFAGLVAIATGVAAVKLALYLARKRRFARLGRDVRLLASTARVALGVLAPPLLLAVDPAGLAWPAVAMAIAGEAIDRCEYYLELDVPTPRRQASEDLEAILSRR
jgi:DMSO reductase iron-sulfur subunit